MAIIMLSVFLMKTNNVRLAHSLE